jgi:hypothetical protein
MRRAPDRVVRLALLDTAASPDTPEQSEGRRAAIARVEAGELEAVLRELAPRLLHPDHQTDATFIGTAIRMGLAVGAKAYIRQQSAIIGRIDSGRILPGSRFQPGLWSAIGIRSHRRIGRRKWLRPFPERGLRSSRAQAI